jgi:hypothetical protein
MILTKLRFIYIRRYFSSSAQRFSFLITKNVRWLYSLTLEYREISREIKKNLKEQIKADFSIN